MLVMYTQIHARRDSRILAHMLSKYITPLKYYSQEAKSVKKRSEDSEC